MSAQVTTPVIDSTPCAGIRSRRWVNPVAQGLLGLVWLYQKTISPVLPALLGPSFGCRFYPSCSHYATDALRERGVFVGLWLTVKRLVKCTPLHPGGFDFVPPARETRRSVPPRCARVTVSA